VNKGEFISAVAEKAGMSKADATKAVDAVIDVIGSAMKKGEEVRLVGFGTFSVKDTPARTGRNPRTGEEIKIPAGKAVKFKPGAQLSA